LEKELCSRAHRSSAINLIERLPPKQVLSQLSYTPTKTTLILNHLQTFRIPIVHKIVMTVPNMMAVDIATQPNLFAGKPRMLFEERY